MDLLDLIVTIAILGVGSLVAGGKKKLSGNKTAPQQQAPRRQVWDTIMEMIGETPANAETVQTANAAEPEAEEVSYFTYEQPEPEWRSPVMEESVAPRRWETGAQQQEQTVETEEEKGTSFDLRTAFVYQTILENKYIMEVK